VLAESHCYNCVNTHCERNTVCGPHVLHCIHTTPGLAKVGLAAQIACRAGQLLMTTPSLPCVGADNSSTQSRRTVTGPQRVACCAVGRDMQSRRKHGSPAGAQTCKAQAAPTAHALHIKACGACMPQPQKRDHANLQNMLLECHMAAPWKPQPSDSYVWTNVTQEQQAYASQSGREASQVASPSSSP
jgi:hypothetical protein